MCGKEEDHGKLGWWCWRKFEDKRNKKLANSGHRLEGIEEDRAGSQGPEQTAVLEEEEETKGEGEDKEQQKKNHMDGS